MIGRSPAFKSVLDLIGRIASCQATVLIEGETGTGKELAARAIHYGGSRAGRPFIPVNCGALPDSLLENELFGHAAGAYTDARTEQPGLVELADGGSLFLDEVDALSPKAQVTLLRFLQDQTYRPLGSRKERRADVRIIAASNRCLSGLADGGGFRMDLLYRLRLLRLTLPPLRDRVGDVGLLARHFANQAALRFGGEPRALSARAEARLEAHAWPGNIRELENIVYQAFLLAGDGELEVDALFEPMDGTKDGDAMPCYREAKDRAIAEFEASYLSRAMDRAGGNVSAAARMIGTERRHLGRLLRKYGIHSPSAS